MVLGLKKFLSTYFFFFLIQCFRIKGKHSLALLLADFSLAADNVCTPHSAQMAFQFIGAEGTGEAL